MGKFGSVVAWVKKAGVAVRKGFACTSSFLHIVPCADKEISVSGGEIRDKCFLAAKPSSLKGVSGR